MNHRRARRTQITFVVVAPVGVVVVVGWCSPIAHQNTVYPIALRRKKNWITRFDQIFRVWEINNPHHKGIDDKLDRLMGQDTTWAFKIAPAHRISCPRENLSHGLPLAT